ncbi:transcription factor Ouib [Drosophila mauritiana]|uniref:Transcription factor Ouib n=1 Tax=Drosophila mauritiana TaxID=7226 RepID=A0A6P8KJU3_DROMA|nr:transcription factor Ouib [Drosophila mauritiana]
MSELRSICRTCGKNVTNSQGRATKLFNKSNYQLISLLENITDMYLEFDNTLPHLICQCCKVQLNRILAFRNKCLEVHKSFMAANRKHLRKRDIVDEELDELDVEKLQQDLGDHKDQEMSEAMAYTAGLLLEDHNDNEDAKHAEDATQNEENQEEQVQTEEVEHCQEQLHNTSIISKGVSARVPKRAKCNSKSWFCDQCGGVFKSSTYLKLHLQRHTGHKPFACDICQAKYYTDNEMRRHRILHTDARPYACRFCSKTYRGCSSKVVHERTHTNERPFQCQHCDMAFTSTSTRQKHEMLHTNQRKYHCEICDQWFLRSSHLTLHQSTKLHQRRAESARIV